MGFEFLCDHVFFVTFLGTSFECKMRCKIHHPCTCSTTEITSIYIIQFDDVFFAWFFIHLVIPDLKSHNAGRDPKP